MPGTTDEGRVQFRDTEMAEWLRERAERMPFPRDRRATPESAVNGQAKAELALWRAILAAELGRIRLTLAQASCIADVLAGSTMDASVAVPLGRVYAECYDAFRIARSGPGGDVSSYGAKHGVDEGALLDYLGSLGPAADHALRDAVSRWWEHVQSRDGLQWRDGDDWDAGSPEGFSAAGLRVTEG